MWKKYLKPRKPIWKKYLKPRKPISREEIKELKQQLKSAKNKIVKEKFIIAALILGAVGATGGAFAGAAAGATGVDFLGIVGGFLGLWGTAGLNGLSASKGEVIKHEKNLAEIQGVEEIDDDRAPILLIRSFDDEEFLVYRYDYSSQVDAISLLSTDFQTKNPSKFKLNCKKYRNCPGRRRKLFINL